MFCLIWKEKNQSSFLAIKKFAKKYNIKKIGHSGTLDPLAEGMLLVATNEDTKFLEFIENKNKTYICFMDFFKTSSSCDSEGETFFYPKKKVTWNQLEKSLNLIKQSNFQIPPAFSAKKINGKKAYEYARKNQKIILKPQKISIYNYSIKNLSTLGCSFEIKVSEGTYIRKIIEDLGLKLKVFGLMSGLQRTGIGNFCYKKNKFLTNFIKINFLKLFPNFNKIIIPNIKILKFFMHGEITTIFSKKKLKNLVIFKQKLVGVVIFDQSGKKIKHKVKTQTISKLLKIYNH